jgi:hypothetical protein
MSNEALILYRQLLKLHKTLPKNMRDLGNKYIKDEFKQHLYPKIPSFNAAHYITFIQSWKKYAEEMQNPEIRMFGRRLTSEEIQAMSPAQKNTINKAQDSYLKK